METWKIWALSSADIEHATEMLGYDMADFSGAHLDKIAHQFSKAVECVCERWNEWLDEAVLDIARDEGIRPRTPAPGQMKNHRSER